jgi:tetratricopeptide (TPR) repeat protein
MNANPHTCTGCGAAAPLYARVNMVYSWMWQGLCSILVGDVPRTKCPRCGHELDLPTMTALLLPEQRRVCLVTGQLGDPAIVQSLQEHIRKPLQPGWGFETYDRLTDLKPTITEHVLSYKPLLKELLSGQPEEQVMQFVRERWRELTPQALAAALVAITGLVPGIGAYAIDRETGGRPDFEQAFEALTDLVGHIQYMVWISIVTSDFTEEYALEDALTEHIPERGIFSGSAETFGKLLQQCVGQKAFTPLHLYAALALYASVAQLKETDNPFELLWGRVFFDFELALLSEGPAQSPLLAWQISQKRARDTVTEKAAWDAVAHRLNAKSDAAGWQALETVASRLGYDNLLGRVMGSMKVSADADGLFSFACRFIDIMMKQAPEHLESILSRLTQSLVGARDLDLIEKVFDYVEPLIGTDRAQQVDLESWYGACVKELRQPGRVIKRIGEEPRAWERDLTVRQRIKLWNERANAFRLLGKPQPALTITEDCLKEIEGQEGFDHQRYVLLRNRGILLRETGAADESRRQLLDLFEKCVLEERARLLESYAATCHALGRHEESIDALQQAVEMGKIHGDDYVRRLKGMLAQEYALLERDDDALKLLDELGAGTPAWDVRLFEASVYLNLVLRGVKLGEDRQQKLEELVEETFHQMQTAEKAEDISLMTQLLSTVGHLQYAVDPVDSEPVWISLLSVRKRYGQPPDPEAIARLAAVAYGRDDRDRALEWLHLLPGAVVQRFGSIKDLAIAFDTTTNLRFCLQHLMRVAMDNHAPWSDIRLIAELRRDTIGRARLIQQRKAKPADVSRLEVGVSDDDVARLAPARGSLGVLEWCSVSRGLLPLLTIIEDSGTVSTKPLAANNLKLSFIRAKLMQRLSVWHETRPGSPFDFEPWRDLASWLQECIGPYLPDGEHLVVIDHQSLVGMPWHVALTPRWRCSYAPSWTTLLDEPLVRQGDALRVGVFAAPRYADSEAVKTSISQAVDSARQKMGAGGHVCMVYENEAADRPAFERLMAECDVVELLCHGYVDPDDREVALLVAHAGVRPPMYTQSKGTFPDAHRLSWRDLQALPRAAPLVLSAACSSGLQWQAGAGEQMGLFGALRQGGTRAFIGPRWDVVAQAVLPLLDTLLDLHINHGVTLVDALHQTCLEAQEHHLPGWLAWSLALEGDWR